MNRAVAVALLREGVMTPILDRAPEPQACRSTEATLKHLGFPEAGRPSTDIPVTPHTGVERT